MCFMTLALPDLIVIGEGDSNRKNTQSQCGECVVAFGAKVYYLKLYNKDVYWPVIESLC